MDNNRCNMLNRRQHLRKLNDEGIDYDIEAIWAKVRVPDACNNSLHVQQCCYIVVSREITKKDCTYGSLILADAF